MSSASWRLTMDVPVHLMHPPVDPLRCFSAKNHHSPITALLNVSTSDSMAWRNGCLVGVGWMEAELQFGNLRRGKSSSRKSQKGTRTKFWLSGLTDWRSVKP